MLNIGYLRAQVLAPSLRCISVNGNSVTLNWIPPADPFGVFTRYEIYNSPTQGGPFTMVGVETNYSQTAFVHNPANGSIQSQYYYVVTISSGSTISAPSDTLRSIFLNVNNTGGKAILNWNPTRVPLLPSASTTYTLYRQSPPSAWVPLYEGKSLSYIDSISICSVFYNYKIETTDGIGCISQSNNNGSLFHDIIQPYVPLLDSVSINASGLATLGWNPSPSADAIGYVIFKQISGIWTAMDTVVGRYNTVFTYTGSTAASVTESYFVTAIDSCANISPPGVDQTSMFLSTTYDLCSRTTKLMWTAYGNLPKGVLDYSVYAAVNGGTYRLVGKVNGTQFFHTQLNPGDNYCYVVRAHNTDQSISASSNRTCIVAKAPRGPSYVYIRSVSVNKNKQVEVTYIVDNSQPFKGATIFKSEDGIHFNHLAFYAATSGSLQTYTDSEVNTTSKNYYYKVQLTDSCGNPGSFSNVSKTILLRVSNDTKTIFYNTLTWDDYSSWSGNVGSYNIYRAVGGVFDPIPIDNVPVSTKNYTDNVESFVREKGKFSYYIEAVEGPANVYGFRDKATSNPADCYLESSIFVPNAFAPRGLNNQWLPMAQFVEKTDYKVLVFDRWGGIVFETSNDTQGWDGNLATDDVYIYLIGYKNARGEYIQLKGHLNVIR